MSAEMTPAAVDALVAHDLRARRLVREAAELAELAAGALRHSHDPASARRYLLDAAGHIDALEERMEGEQR